MPPKKAPTVLDSNAALLRFAEEQYLSSLSIRRVAPPPVPGDAPSTVRFTWELDVPGELVPYDVVASGVRRWSLDGAMGEGPISWSLDDPADAPIALTMVVSGVLRLACERLSVTRGRAKRKPRRVGSLAALAYFTLDGVGAPSAAMIVRALSDAPGARLASRGATDGDPPLADGPHALVLGERTIAKLHFAAGRAGGWLSVARDGATDGEWRRALVAPRDLPSTAVTGPLELFASAEEWLGIVATIP